MARKKVLIISNEPSWTYNLRREIIEELINEGYSVAVAVSYGEKIELLKEKGCKHYDVSDFAAHGTNPIKELKLLKRYRKIIDDYKPDLVITYTLKPNVYGGMAAAMKKIPYISTVAGLGIAVENGGIMKFVTTVMLKTGLRKARCIFVQNTLIEKFCKENNIGRDNLVLVPGSGVNVQQHCYEEYPSEDRETIFVTLGRIMKDKGSGELFETAKNIRKDYPNVRFVMVGNDDGGFQEEIDNATREGIIERMDFQSEVHHIIKECNAIVHPSYHEGIANVLLEGAATGRPVIATDVPGCIETFEPGVTGIVCKARDAADLERAVREFLELSYERKVEMGRLGREKVIREFNRKIVVDKTMNEIHKII